MSARLFIIMLLMLPSPGRAASQEAISYARELVELLKADQPLRDIAKMAGAVSTALPKSTRSTKSKSADQVLESSIEEFKKQAVEIYVSEYSEEELRDIVAFLKSSSGARFLEKQPEIVRKQMRLLTEAPSSQK